MGVVVAVKLVRDEVQVPPHGAVQIALLASGVLSLAVFVSTSRHPVDRIGLQIAETVTGTALVLLGLYFGFLAGDATWVPRSVQTFGAGVTGGIAVILVALGCLTFVRGHPAPLPPLAGTGRHLVHVYDVRPDPNDRKNQFEAYFLAGCDCGWNGDVRGSSDEAFADALDHDPNVAAGLERPVG